MPVLPQKRKVSGTKKSGDELQSDLVEYMHDLLKIPFLQRMIFMRMFLSVNSYSNISEESFNQMGAYEGLSPMNINVPNYEDMSSPRVLDQRASERNLIRESADID